MDSEKQQQALDNFRLAIGRLEQSGFDIRCQNGDFKQGVWIYVKDAQFEPDVSLILTTSSNHTLRLKKHK